MILKSGAIASALALVLLAVTTTAGLACNKNFLVFNRTDKTMVKFFVSPHQADDWEDNLLSADDPIEPDTKSPIDMSDDDREVSLYDVKAVFDDGSKSVGGNINLCRATAIYIYSNKVTYDEADH